ncbi:Scr1 family TA system antitoxin-like transcriptional regulator [Streptomyces sp. L7]
MSTASDVALGEQGLHTNVGGPEVMCGQMERLLRDIDLPLLTLGVLATTAEVSVVPMPGFNMRGSDAASTHELVVSSGVDFTDPAELAPPRRAFTALSNAASYGKDARGLITKALKFWSDEAK